MNNGDIFRLILIVVGVLLLGNTIMSLAKRRLTEPFCLAWGFFSVILILAGILLRPTVLGNFISPVGIVLSLALGLIFIGAAYFVSRQISDLVRKNRELTMQVSLLNQENERILAMLEELSGKHRRDFY